MMSTLAFLTLCGTLLLANAQQDCNMTCDTNPCSEGAVCPRFLNADCEVDTCNCMPRYIFRRRDVTDRCGVSCDTRECGLYRQCMEGVDSNPPGCTGQRKCRQRLRTKCVRVPRPMSCEDVDCGEGLMCRMRNRTNRPPVVRCVPALPTTEPPTTTEQTTTPTAFTTTTDSNCAFDCSIVGQTCEVRGGIPTCVQPTVCTEELMAYCEERFQECRESDGTTSCVQRTSCDPGVSCPDSRFQCYEVSPTVTGRNNTVAQCFFPVGPTCDKISCDDFEGCLTLQVRNFSFASCFEPQNVPPITCDAIECSEGTVCVDFQRAGLPAMVRLPFTETCLTVGCNDTTGCDPFTSSACTTIPPELGLAVDSVCIPSNINLQVGNETCAESGRVCTGIREACLDALIGNTLVGTSCSPVSRYQLQSPTCQNSLCFEGDECGLEIREGSPPVQSCVPTTILDPTLLSYMDILDSF